MRRNELIKKMRPLLLKRRKALLLSLRGDMERLSTADRDVRDIADEAIEAEYRNVSAELTQLETRELEQIENALRRISDGKYGDCDQCAKHIPMARLQALPYATMCIKCQQNADRCRSTYAPANRIANIVATNDPDDRTMRMAHSATPSAMQ